MDISTKILLDSTIESNRDSKNIIFSRIKEITLEAFSKQFTDEIHHLQAELRTEQALNDQIRREFLEREQRILQEFDSKQREFQLEQIREIKNLQDLLEGQESQFQKYQLLNEKLKNQIKDMQNKEVSLQNENIRVKENLQLSDQRNKSLSSDLCEQRQRNEALNSLNQQLDRQNRDFKIEFEKVLKELSDLKKKSQQQIDLNVQLDQELEILKNENERLKTKKLQDQQKQKELLDQLKEKSNAKINDLKNKLTQAQNTQLHQQQQLEEFQELIKESENQLNQLQQNHRQSTKQLEQQYKNQFQEIEIQYMNEKQSIEDILKVQYEQILVSKEKMIQDQIKEIKLIKDKIYQQNLEFDNLQRQNQHSQQQVKQLQGEIKQLNQHQEELEKINRERELELSKKDLKLKNLLLELDDVKNFSEQTLNTMRSNQNQFNEIEKERQYYLKLFQQISDDLEIEIQGSFSYQRIGQKVDLKLKQFRDDFKKHQKESKKLIEQHAQEIQEKEQKLMLLQDNFNDENNKIQKILSEQQIENRKQKNEFKQKLDEQNRIIIELQKDQIQNNNQLEFLQIQNQQLAQDLEKKNESVIKAQKEIHHLLNRDQMNYEDSKQVINQIVNEKNQIQLQLEESLFKQKTCKQRIYQILNRQRELMNIQLFEVKNTFINKLRQLESECKIILQNLYKQQLIKTENKILMIEAEKQYEIEQMNCEIEQKIENMKYQFKQSELLIQEEGQFKLKQKQQQIEQLIMSKNNSVELQNQIHSLHKENEELKKQLLIQEQLKVEQRQNHELELLSLNKLIKEQQEELSSQQQFSEYTMNRERQYFEQRYQDLKQRQDKKMEQVQSDYQLQINQLENIIQLPSKQVSPYKVNQKSPYQKQSILTTNKQQNFSTPIISTAMKTPNKKISQIDNADKTIEDLRQEIEQQKEKLSKMKLSFTESQKKPYRRV
ncbi:unnamed protein product (macronuclear) [Paramecium tetraurelia]|uniref:Uncharacterized protein n=1 Tax=Paramecium tetraurelia TaxID=5888 RepID=A0C587_PARTE|nr:uncharacterized protein GSPATT00006453001 [Paramecium tetraurelia]CAK65954.1 unnamed protein product [Paramecium tetraurelia]|eukprot:XP_001433351.1 hypothetical protein (macronuclear) [Paramecium tetraurelia strain d4-2]